MKKFFDVLTSAINGSDRSVLDLLSALVPYAVPVIPAYLTYYHALNEMDFPSWVAWTAAFVVEALGMASVSTAIRFWRNNQKYKDEKNKAPFGLAIFVYIFYLVIVITVNVVLEVYSGTRTSAIIFAIGLFSLLSLPSGVLVSIRAQYSEFLEEKHARRNPTSVVEEEKPMGFSTIKYASNYREKILAKLDEQYARNQTVLAPKAITMMFKLDHNNNKGYVSNLTKEWRETNNIPTL